MDVVLREKSTREFEYRPADFERVRRLIRERAGISLATSKRDMVYSRLAKRVRTLKLRSIGDYLDRIDVVEGEWEAFVNALTTNLTSFFREAHHFTLLDRLVRERAGQRLRIWCAAASTGEEPWSIALTVAAATGRVDPPLELLATDIDTNVLRQAEAGVYDVERVAHVPERCQAYLQAGRGAKAGLVRVHPELRRLVTFRQLNLTLEDWDVRGQFDLIFCRNVLIYFDRSTQRAILQRFAPLVARDGRLITGHSESLFHATDLFTPVGQTTYRLA